MTLLSTLLYFILAVALLITVHEWGHFLAARLVGVKVLRFSVGFGKPLLSWRDKKNTEYVLAMFPLGGYVKMLDESEGDVPADELNYAFNRKSVWARILVVVAGPLFNLLFAVFALWLMYVIGIFTLAPIVGKITPHSAAAHAKFEPMDKIIAADNKKISSWRQFQMVLMPLIGDQGELQIDVKPADSEQIKQLTVQLNQWKLDPKHPNLLASLGLSPYVPKIQPIIAEVMPGQAAAAAGLAANDKIIAIDGQVVDDWYAVVDAVKLKPEQAVIMRVQRGDRQLNITVYPRLKKNKGQSYGFIGLKPQASERPSHWYQTVRYSPLNAISPAIHETWDLTLVTFRIIGKFIRGDMSVKTISGPIGIAQGAGQSARGGIAYYLAFLALVSISLGVLNLLPIPMLDGGHLLYYLIEVILRRPVSENIQELGMKVGLLVLTALIILAVFNDVTRLLT